MEIAITVALLVVTGGMLNTYRRQIAADIGFKTQSLIRLRVENSGGLQVGRLADSISQMPGVSSVAPSTSIPYATYGPMEPVSTDRSGSDSMQVERATIAPNFFTTLGVPLRTGRMFTRADSTTTRTAIINESLAARLYTGRDPIGRSLWLQGAEYEVVGLVAQYANQALQPHKRDPKVFLPFDESRSVNDAELLVRASSDSAALVRTLRREAGNVAAGSVAVNVYTLDEMVAVSGQEILVGTAPLVPLIAIGMLLTAAGIYGVLAFAITRRSTELAVRIAIGATGRQVARFVTVQSLHLIAMGAGLGVGVTFAISRMVRAAGGEGSFMDPSWPAFVIPVLIVIAIAAGATWAPSRRALRINPAELLRAD
jgi:ABC-type antimicrobial peptide transport system permease subunit